MNKKVLSLINNLKLNNMTNEQVLERLLNGEEATYDGDKILQIIKLPKIETNSEYIVLINLTEDKIYYAGTCDLNHLSKVVFTNSTPKPRTIQDGLRYGDIIVSGKIRRKVLGICGDIIFLSDETNFEAVSHFSTLKVLINCNYKLEEELQQSVEEVQEMTLNEALKELGKHLGKTVKIVE